RKYHPFIPGHLTEFVHRSIELFTAEVLERPGGNPAPDPIFVVGMPRAGSTLLEQMLAAGGEVEPLGELPAMIALARSLGSHERLIDASYLDRLVALPCARLAELGRSYLAAAAPLRRQSTPRFSDKMPNNWLMTGLIALALPRAHIVDVRRHPLDCGLSNFRENFARGQAYSYDLAHIGAYYADYVRLMAHFDRLLPGTVHRVIYERLIDNPERELRALCANLGLPYSDAMVSPHLNAGAVRTASAAQVRQPLNRRGLGAWRRYEDHLAPLREALGPVLESWDRPAAA
ncbi:MAG: sulfotransferase family protein, partial [Tsuneonella sp.]